MFVFKFIEFGYAVYDYCDAQFGSVNVKQGNGQDFKLCILSHRDLIFTWYVASQIIQYHQHIR